MATSSDLLFIFIEGAKAGYQLPIIGGREGGREEHKLCMEKVWRGVITLQLHTCMVDFSKP